MIHYLREHWTGRHGFVQAVGVNVVLLNILIVLLLEQYIKWGERSGQSPHTLLLVAMAVFFIATLLWQSVGAFRSATLSIRNHGSSAHYYGVLGAVLISSVTILGNLATLNGGYIDYRQRAVDEYRAPIPHFNIEKSPAGLLTFSGDIDRGATQALREIVSELPLGATLTLDSVGGLIVEARGMANVVKEYSLHTHVTRQCFSACTLVFIAGSLRTMDDSGSLGFHQYDVYSQSVLPWIVPEDEQKKDFSLFWEKQVPQWFLEKAYSTPHDSIWLPTRDELIAAGVIENEQ